MTFVSRGTPVTEGAYTPTGAWTTNTTYHGRYRIELGPAGYLLTAQIRLVLSGAPNAASLTVSYLPAGWSVNTGSRWAYDRARDTPSILTAPQWHVAGWGMIDDSGTAVRGPVVPIPHGSVVHLFYLTNVTTWGQVTRTAPITFGSGDTLSFTIVDIPVEAAA